MIMQADLVNVCNDHKRIGLQKSCMKINVPVHTDLTAYMLIVTVSNG